MKRAQYARVNHLVHPDNKSSQLIITSGCFKGLRECTYPESKPKTRTKSSKSDPAKPAPTIAEESDSENEDADIEEKLSSHPVHKTAGKNSKRETGARRQGRTKRAASLKQDAPSHKQPIPSIERTKQDPGVRESPETDGSSPQSASQAGSRSSCQLDSLTSESSMSPEKISFSHLPRHQRCLLEYLRNNITYHHYFFRSNANYFLHNILIEQALSYEPLLHAVVGFAAFHETLGRSNGRIQDFLGYYNKSVSLLLKSLAGGQRPSEAMLLTILQLAAFEVLLSYESVMLDYDEAYIA